MWAESKTYIILIWAEEPEQQQQWLKGSVLDATLKSQALHLSNSVVTCKVKNESYEVELRIDL